MTDRGPDLHSLPPLPGAARRALVRLAADVLGAQDPATVPVALRRVRAFAPVQRARLGATALALALEQEAGFRARVLTLWRERNPEVAAALDSGPLPPAVDPTVAVTALYLQRPDGWHEQLAHRLAGFADGDPGDSGDGPSEADGSPEAERSRRIAAEAARDRLTDERDRLAGERDRLADELAGLKREQRRLRSDADRARSEARAAEQSRVDELERSAARLAELERGAADARARMRSAERELAGARDTARAGREALDVRTRLLLETVVDAAAGLRRELALPPTTRTPADLVAGTLVEPRTGPTATPGLAARGRAPDDPGALLELLRMPRAHLVVDGYNVTKAAYGTLPLVDQRRLLVDALAALAGRTQAEITCCFDGADVAGPRSSLNRGVRVLFSDPGTIADELIRRLVRAEPEGRVVVVASSDREVADGVLAAGARPVPTDLLLALLGSGGRGRRA